MIWLTIFVAAFELAQKTGDLPGLVRNSFAFLIIDRSEQ
jgi:hypothetical protein